VGAVACFAPDYQMVESLRLTFFWIIFTCCQSVVSGLVCCAF